MNLVDLIESYIMEEVDKQENGILEVKRCDLAETFSCVPSQINYVIATRFAPEMGFYVETRRGGGGYIRIKRVVSDKLDITSDMFDKMGDKMSQHVGNMYLKSLLDYNIIDESSAEILTIVMSDNTLSGINVESKEKLRANIFKNVIINII
ncbi:MAG: CtsR family transcriptional regulator [Clostridia bacterium]|nr:CtsR family transcriptional regulator [Clostridia bacterium]MDD4376356.1 CtsR family transcriptional regulator [Clostridia bacterium]